MLILFHTVYIQIVAIFNSLLIIYNFLNKNNYEKEVELGCGNNMCKEQYILIKVEVLDLSCWDFLRLGYQEND